jgi:hypothetical protein
MGKESSEELPSQRPELIVIVVILGALLVSLPLQIDIKWAITTLMSFIGLLGGLPSLMEHFKEKPDLKVFKVVHAVTYITVFLRNDGNRIATNVRCRWVIYRVDTNTQVDQSEPSLERIGYIGPHKEMITDAIRCNSIHEEFKHEIMIGLSCSEKDFGYVVLPLEKDF